VAILQERIKRYFEIGTLVGGNRGVGTPHRRTIFTPKFLVQKQIAKPIEKLWRVDVVDIIGYNWI
jgi:hypothetical protein